jgi:hypothetical protein
MPFKRKNAEKAMDQVEVSAMCLAPQIVRGENGCLGLMKNSVFGDVFGKVARSSHDGLVEVTDYRNTVNNMIHKGKMT